MKGRMLALALGLIGVLLGLGDPETARASNHDCVYFDSLEQTICNVRKVYSGHQNGEFSGARLERLQEEARQRGDKDWMRGGDFFQWRDKGDQAHHEAWDPRRDRFYRWWKLETHRGEIVRIDVGSSQFDASPTIYRLDGVALTKPSSVRPIGVAGQSGWYRLEYRPGVVGTVVVLLTTRNERQEGLYRVEIERWRVEGTPVEPSPPQRRCHCPPGTTEREGTLLVPGGCFDGERTRPPVCP